MLARGAISLGAILSVLGLAGVVASAPAAAAEETVVNFDSLAVGEPVTTQYASQGAEFGTAESFKAPKPPHGDCGAPTVQASASAPSPPNYALLAQCGRYSGTYVSLRRHPRGTPALRVHDFTAGVPAGAKVKLTAYDTAGGEVSAVEAEAGLGGSWTTLTAANPGNVQLGYLAIATAGATEREIGIDDVAFEAPPPGEEPPGGGGGGSGGGKEPPPPPISASIALQTPARAGQLLTLTGAGSQPGSGGRIISYDWDFNGDGNIDTSTGTNPAAHVILAPGLHTIGLTVTGSNGEKSSTKLGLLVPAKFEPPPQPDGGEGPCEPTYEEGEVKIVAECVQKLAGGGYVIETKLLELNGMVLAPQGGGYGVFKIQTLRDFVIDGSVTNLSGPRVNVELLNTPIGDVVLGGRNLESEPMQIGLHSNLNQFKSVILNHGAGGPLARVADEEASSKKLLMAFGVGHACKAGSKDVGCCPPSGATTSCATLPGGFPLTGQVDVYLNNKGQSLFDVQVGLELSAVNFQATGALEIEADPQNGINLNSLKFAIEEASLASIFKVKETSFVYYFPSDPDPSKRDTWQAKGKITFGLLEEPGLEGELSFQHGQFHSASMVLTLPPGAGVPIYPGITLNKLGAGVGVEPFRFEGTLGASIATQLELTLQFRFREATENALGFFGGKGSLSFKDDEIAQLAADVYSDGYVDALVKFDLHFPFESKDPVIKVFGEVGFWDEPPSGLWQAEGILGVKLWIINAEIGALVNNDYVAGCLGAEFGIQGRYRFSDGNVDGGFYGLSNCKDQLKQYQIVPLKEHKGGFVGEEVLRFPEYGRLGLGPFDVASSARTHGALASAGGGATFTIPRGKMGEELRVGSATGTPVVTLTSPDGERFSSPAAAGGTSEVKGKFISAVSPDPHKVLLFLRNPRTGLWHIAAARGSAPITSVEGAEDVPPAVIRAHVHREGTNRYALAYSIGHFVRGTHVRFVERGRDSTHVLGTVSRASGKLAFTPQAALGRARTIVAYLLDAEGAPVRALTVTRYTAPRAQRPARPRRVSFKRSGTTALLSWSAVAGARVYRVKIRGSDGRLQTFFRKPRQRSVRITRVLPFETFAATVTPVGGAAMLAGQSATAKLARQKIRLPKVKRAHHKKH
jgi:PKD repeat protein